MTYDLESPSFFQKLLDSSLNGIMVFDAIQNDNGTIVDFTWKLVNSVASNLVGMESKALIGKQLLENMPEILGKELFDIYIEVAETGVSLSFQVNATKELGKWFRLQVVQFEEGLIVTILDITELKEAEAEVIRKGQLLMEAQELAKLGSWTWDLEQNQVEWSENVYKIYEISDLSFRPSYEFFFDSMMEEDKIRIAETIGNATKTGETYDITFRIVVEDKIKHLQARAVPKLNIDGKVQAYVGIIRDVSLEKERQLDLKKADQKLLRMGKAASSERMARSIAHEIRNPLTNITLASEQLKSESDKDSKIMFLEMIERNSQRIDALIMELMESAKPAELQLGYHDVHDIIEDTLQLAKDRIKLRGVKIKKQFAPAMVKILIDREKVKIALLNIIINAIEAIEQETGEICIETHLDDAECTIKISDNGPGIPHDMLNQLFDPFFTKKTRGIGLGLTTTLNIINSHDGNIEVSSELGKGTSFLISFQK